MSKFHVGIGFALGLLTGAGATYFFLNKRMDAQLEKDTAEIKKVYREEIERLKKARTSDRESIEKLSEKYADEMAEKYADVKQEPTAYDKISDYPKEEDFDKDGKPYNPEGVDISDSTIPDEIPEGMEDQYVAPRPRGNRVYIIDEDIYAGDPQYEKFQITYYEADGVWADDQDEVLQPSDFLSEGIDLLPTIQELLVTEDAVYVRNNGTWADYEIISLETSYVETVFGKR